MTAPDEERLMIMHRQWMDGYGHPWLWLLTSTAIVLLWGGALWAAVGLFRRGSNGAAGGGSAGGAPSTPGTDRDPRASAERILAERLARGEIDVDEFRTRLAALRPDDASIT